jgi:hypothetical protein
MNFKYQNSSISGYGTSCEYPNIQYILAGLPEPKYWTISSGGRSSYSGNRFEKFKEMYWPLKTDNTEIPQAYRLEKYYSCNSLKLKAFDVTERCVGLLPAEQLGFVAIKVINREIFNHYKELKAIKDIK